MRIRYLAGICLLLAAAGWARAASEQMEYFAVFMDGKKVGHAIQGRVVANGKVTTTEQASLTMSRANVPVTVNTTETCIETTDGKPLGFECVQDLGIMMMKVAGTVNKEGKVEIAVTSMGSEQKSTAEWPSGAMMSEGVRLLQMKKGLKEGLEYTAKVYSPAMMQALDVQIRVGAKQNVDLLGRIVALTQVVTTVTMPGAGQIVNTSYVDKDLRVQKSTVPMMGMQVEMIACAKEFALGENDVLELVGKMFLASPVPLGDVGKAESIAYCLRPTVGTNELKIPATDNQTVRPGKEGQVIVTVKPVSAPARVKFPYKGKDAAILEAMKPTRFVQSDRKEIVELARSAVGNTKDAAEAVKKIESFVAKYMENKDLSVGYASAAEVAASKQGDCSEFSVLTAAMCRAVGIPAQVVVGVAYVKDWAGLHNGFGGHAWVQAFVGDRWIGLDAAFKSAELGGYGPGHIALVTGNGNPEDFFSLVNTMGQFKIDKVTVKN